MKLLERYREMLESKFVWVLVAAGLTVFGLAGCNNTEGPVSATATAGVSVVVAGATVLLSLFGLAFAGLPTYRSFGSATALVVAVVVVSATGSTAASTASTAEAGAVVTVSATGSTALSTASTRSDASSSSQCAARPSLYLAYE